MFHATHTSFWNYPTDSDDNNYETKTRLHITSADKLEQIYFSDIMNNKHQNPFGILSVNISEVYFNKKWVYGFRFKPDENRVGELLKFIKADYNKWLNIREFQLKRDDKLIAKGTYNELWLYLHKNSSGNSVDWLLKYEGYNITEV